MRRYDLTFIEAAERCLNGKGFIRGENFAPGTYVKVENGVLVLKDKKGNDSFPLPISKGVLSQNINFSMLQRTKN
jgi:hypothetical protein